MLQGFGGELGKKGSFGDVAAIAFPAKPLDVMEMVVLFSLMIKNWQ